MNSEVKNEKYLYPLAKYLGILHRNTYIIVRNAYNILGLALCQVMNLLSRNRGGRTCSCPFFIGQGTFSGGLDVEALWVQNTSETW